MKIKRYFVLQELEDNSWNILEYMSNNDPVYVSPIAHKVNTRTMMAGLSQLLDISPVTPQTYPEKVGINRKRKWQ